MDRKSVIVLVICGLLFFGWAKFLMPRYDHGLPPSPRTNQVLTSSSSNGPPAEVSAAPTNAPATPTTAAQVRPSVPEELLVEENDKARYTFSSYGGGLKVVELKEYPEVISCREKNAPGTQRFASLNTFAEQPVLNLTTLDGLQGDGVFKLSKIDHGIRAEKTLPNGLLLVKEFRLSSNYLVDAIVRIENHSAQVIALPRREWTLGTASPINPQDNGQLLGVTWYNGSAQNVEGTYFGKSGGGCIPGCSSGSSHTEYHAFATNLIWASVRNQFFALAVMTPTNEAASDLFVHPIALPPAHDETNAPPAASATAASLWLFDETDFKDASGFAGRLKGGQDRLSAYLFSRLSEETKRLLASFGGGTLSPELFRAFLADLNKILPTVNLYQDNRDYFGSLTLRPAFRRLVDQNPGADERTRLNRVLLEDAYSRELQPSPTGYEVTVSYPPATVPANQGIDRAFTIYAGPKEYKTINRIGLQFNNSLDEVMWTSAVFFAVFFAKMLLVSMNGLHALGLPYAGAIISITIIIKGLFWPLTQASTRSMKRMQALQPEIKAIQAKYKDDPMKVQKRTMELFKEHKVSPLGGCLPMLLQLPVFIGFYTMIRTAIELRGASFLWVCDLSAPDTLFLIPGLGFIPFIGLPGVGLPINLLPLIMGVTMLWQARLTPASPGMDPSQQKIMKYMPVMFLFILYNFSAGLTLYWTVQNLLTIAQTKLTRAKEEKTGAGPASPSGPPQKKKK